MIGPPLAGRELTRLLQYQLELFVRREPEAMAGVPAVGLEELHDVADPVLETACVVQELADRDPFSEGRGITVEVEQALRNELKDERGDEDLRHAPDAEAVIDRDDLARS